MKQRGVLVKNLNGSHPLLAQCLRITAGSAEENALCLDALRAAL
jgi:histidinol-phosphate aminotransferase